MIAQRKRMGCRLVPVSAARIVFRLLPWKERERLQKQKDAAKRILPLLKEWACFSAFSCQEFLMLAAFLCHGGGLCIEVCSRFSSKSSMRTAIVEHELEVFMMGRGRR